MTDPADAVEEYLSGFPPEVREILEQVRAAVREAFPEPGEDFKYKMLLITSQGREILYIGGWKKHVGLYPVPVGDAAFEAEVGPYRSSKDTVKFVYAKPVPYDLITRIAALAVSTR